MKEHNWLLCLTLVITIIHCSLSNPVPSEEYTHSVALTVSEDYHVFWKFDDVFITFEVHVRSRGYVGFGLSRTGGMKGADMVIGWVANGNVTFHDRHSESESMPVIDESQDWFLLSGEETDSHTKLKFYRKLDTCDQDDIAITPDTIRLIWSYSLSDPSDEENIPYHGTDARGSRSLQLLSPVLPIADLPDNTFNMDFLNRAVRIPDTSFTYWCQGFQVPPLSGKHHVIKVEPVIQPGHEGLVHHIVLYGCYHEPAKGGWEELDGLGHVCYSQMPLDDCTTALFGWAIGGQGYTYPEHVGFPLGGSESHNPLFLRLETHYDNPDEISGLVDSSGLRLHMTARPRQYDAGLLEVGSKVWPPALVIPPHYPAFRTLAHCPSTCTRRRLNGTIIHMFGGYLHTHFMGTALRLRHFRNETELPVIAKDESYDFNFQEFRHLEKEVAIEPGDYLALECQYNSETKSRPVYGGPSTRDEMCLAYMQYYPRVDLSACHSLPTFQQSLTFINATMRRIASNPYYIITEPKEFEGMSFFDVMSMTNWTNATTRRHFQERVNVDKAWMECSGHGPTQIYKESDVVDIPKYVKLMEPLKSKPCSREDSVTEYQSHINYLSKDFGLPVTEYHDTKQSEAISGEENSDTDEKSKDASLKTTNSTVSNLHIDEKPNIIALNISDEVNNGNASKGGRSGPEYVNIITSMPNYPAQNISTTARSGKNASTSEN